MVRIGDINLADKIFDSCSLCISQLTVGHVRRFIGQILHGLLNGFLRLFRRWIRHFGREGKHRKARISHGIYLLFIELLENPGHLSEAISVLLSADNRNESLHYCLCPLCE